MTPLRYGSCVGSLTRARDYIETVLDAMEVNDGHSREFIGLSGQPSLAVAYNRILSHYAAQDTRGAVVLLHDDLEITDPDFEAKVEHAMTAHPDAGLIGVCGGLSGDSLAWWNGPSIGHQYTDAGLLDFGQRTGLAGVLEGSVLVFTPWALRNLRYDERYPGFHSADTVCLDARQAGRTLVVADIDTHHHTYPGRQSERGARDWAAGEALYQQKRSATR